MINSRFYCRTRWRNVWSFQRRKKKFLMAKCASVRKRWEPCLPDETWFRNLIDRMWLSLCGVLWIECRNWRGFMEPKLEFTWGYFTLMPTWSHFSNLSSTENAVVCFVFFRWVVFVLALQSETLSFSMGVVKWMLWLSLFRQFPFFRVILISRLKANIVFPAVHSWPVLVHSKFYTCLTPMDSFSDPDFYCSVRWSNIENNVDHKLVYYRRKSQIF